MEVLRDRTAQPAIDVDPGITSGDYLTGFLVGTREALSEAGRRSVTITLDRVDAHRLGALVALFERAVGLYASLIDVNAYDQPGVEAGKKAAIRALEAQTRLLDVLRDALARSLALEEVARAAGCDPVLALSLLRHLHANGRVVRHDAASGSVLEARWGIGRAAR
jgi:glucose-6-phosphate isomerase